MDWILRADPLAAEFRRRLGMHESDDTIGELVIGRSHVAVDREFVAVMGLVVDNFAHGICFRKFYRLNSSGTR